MADSVEDKGSLNRTVGRGSPKNGGSGERAEKRLQCCRPTESVRSEVSLDVDHWGSADGFSVLSPARASERSLSVAGFSSTGAFTGSTLSSSGQG